MPTKYELRRAIGKAYGSWFWHRPGRFGYLPGIEGKRERVTHILAFRTLRKQLRNGEYTDEINTRGNTVIRDQDADIALEFLPGGDRYAYDFGPCKGWIQFDTHQDASYFGLWVDTTSRRTFTYCEGDRTLVVCPTQASFRAELEDASRFYDAAFPKELADSLQAIEAQ